MTGPIAVTALWLCVAPVFAHEETALEAVTVIDDIRPRTDGVSFRVAHLTQPVLIATNRTDETLVIFGRNDEPFLRLADGRIESNANSPLTYTTRSPGGLHTSTPENIDLDAPPIWRLVDRGRSWSWFDPRIRRDSAGGPSWKVLAALGPHKSGLIEISGSFESFDAHGHFTTRMESAPRVRGLDVDLNDGPIPALFVQNETGQVLHVTGRSGEGFLRIGPEGVFGNTESPDLYLGGLQTIRPVPPGVEPQGRPRWRRLSSVPVWSWLELRARLPAEASLRSTLGTEPHPVIRWTTPMRLGRKPVNLTGVVEWVPPAGLDRSLPDEKLPWPWLALPLVLGALLVWRLKVRRGRNAGSLSEP